jgi:hypothetical protein
MFEQRALPITEDIMFKWRLLVEDGRKAGHTLRRQRLSKGARARAQSLARRGADKRLVNGSFLDLTSATKKWCRIDRLVVFQIS